MLLEDVRPVLALSLYNAAWPDGLYNTIQASTGTAQAAHPGVRLHSKKQDLYGRE